MQPSCLSFAVLYSLTVSDGRSYSIVALLVHDTCIALVYMMQELLHACMHAYVPLLTALPYLHNLMRGTTAAEAKPSHDKDA